MKIKKTVAVFNTILICMLLLCGCWDRRELNTLGIVSAVAIDMEDDNIKMTFEVIKPNRGRMGGGGDKDETTVYVQSTGKSTFDAIRRATLVTDRRLFFPHCSEYIFSEEFARKGLANFLDFWNRDHENRRRTYLVIAKGCRASEVLGAQGGIERESAHYLRHLVENTHSNARSVNVNVRNFLMQYYADGIEPVAISVPSKQKKEKIGDEKEKHILSTEGAAIFKEDKLIGFIDGDEALGFNIVRNELKSAVIAIPSLDGNGITSVEFNSTKAKSKVEVLNGRAKITVNIKIAATLGEETGKINLRENSVVEQIEKEVAEDISKRIYNLIEKAQKEYEADFLGFGNTLYHKNYKQWKQVEDQWDKVFTRADIIVKVDPEIDRRGYINLPAGLQEVKK